MVSLAKKINKKLKKIKNKNSQPQQNPELKTNQMENGALHAFYQDNNLSNYQLAGRSLWSGAIAMRELWAPVCKRRLLTPNTELPSFTFYQGPFLFCTLNVFFLFLCVCVFRKKKKNYICQCQTFLLSDSSFVACKVSSW